MKRWTLLLGALGALAAALLVAALPARSDYLGEPASVWQLRLAAAKDVSAKRSAAFALGKCGLQALQAVPDLIKCLESESEDASVRETAAYSIGQIVLRGSARPDLVRLLCQFANTKKGDERVTRSAIVALGTCGTDSSEIRAALERALEDPRPAVRQNAAWALGEICQTTDEPPISSLRVALSSQEQDSLVKRDAALALGNIVSQRSSRSVIWENSESQERKRLEKVREQARAAIPELIDCVGNDSVELKKAAAGALVNIVNSKDANARAVLAKACDKKEDIEVRFNAAQALAAIGGKGSEAAVPVLQDVLRSSKGNPEWRQNAVLAFRNLGSVGAKALPDLLQVLAKDSDKQVRYHTAVALDGWKSASKQVVPALVQRVVAKDEDGEVRAAAAVSLWSIGPCDPATAAIPLLLKVLADPQEPTEVRFGVLRALRVNESDLQKYDEFFAALKAIVSDPTLRNRTTRERLLAYDSAFLLGVFKGPDAPAEVFPVMEIFLKDNDLRLFTGVMSGGGHVAEGGGGKSVVAEQGIDDGRLAAVRGLQSIGPQRVKTQEAIITQLRVLRDTDHEILPKLREAAAKLLKDCGVK
jgi:HEAT repeat protein